MEKHIFDEKTGIGYTLHGDYYLPDLDIKETEDVYYGKYGMLRKNFLKEHKDYLYLAYLLDGTLNEHLNEMDEQANTRMEVLMRQMMKKQGVDEKLKARDQMLWVGMVNNIRNAAEEIVLNELIYQ